MMLIKVDPLPIADGGVKLQYECYNIECCLASSKGNSRLLV